MFSKIAAQLSHPTSLFTPCPPITDRAPWETLPAELKDRLIAAGEMALAAPLSIIPTTDFMDFCRTGNRSHYQDQLFSRRTLLNTLVLAECVEAQGRFLDAIINYVFAICEESAWQLPAHNSYIRDTPQFILPDITRPVIDLFAAETGAVLAVTEYLLRRPLEQISPYISVNINDNLERRIFKPYLEEHFWWMGDGTSQMNNWTSWCTQNVLLAAFTRELPKEKQKAIFLKACQSLDYFMAEYGEDGCCEEGAQYYRHAGLTLFNSIEVLNGITGGGFEKVYENTKVKNIASYILNAHVEDIYFINFADCCPVAGRCNAREYLFGKRTKNSALMAFAAQDYQKSEDPLIPEEHNLFYRLQTVFHHKEMMACKTDAPIEHPDIFYPSVGLFITRDEHFCLAVKGGDNNDSHNHNDTGSFTIYKDGKPMFIDVGVESYTKKTFSPQRYEIWTMQSQYHNLPAFDGIMQMNGEEYKATDISWELTKEAGQISMDIAGAYPDEKIVSYRRLARLEKGKGIMITDAYTGTRLPAILSLMTYEKPVLNGDTLTIGDLGTCRITGASHIETETIPIPDERLKQAWKHDIYRILVTMESQELQLEIS